MNDQINNKLAVLVVDDEVQVRLLLQRIVLQTVGTCFLAADGEEALKILAKETVDVVITDIAMPKMNGIELTKRIKSHYDIDVIMLTGFFKNLSYGGAISKGASDFIKKPFENDEIQLRLNRVLRERNSRTELKESLQTIQVVLNGVINSLSSTVEARDPYTSGHQKRVSAIAVSIAQTMGLSENQTGAVRMAALIHDLGKIAIPAEILSKPGRLSKIEFSLIKTHPEVGYDILKDIIFTTPIADIVHQHHERMDGSGYPRGLKGEEILLESRIIAVADVVEAMSSHRPYRPALGIDMAMEEIASNKGNVYDPDVVKASLKCIRSTGVQDSSNSFG